MDVTGLKTGTKVGSDFCRGRSIFRFNLSCFHPHRAEESEEEVGHEYQANVVGRPFQRSSWIIAQSKVMLDVLEQTLDRPSFQIPTNDFFHGGGQGIGGQVVDSLVTRFTRENQANTTKPRDERIPLHSEKGLLPECNPLVTVADNIGRIAPHLPKGSMCPDLSVGFQVCDEYELFILASLQDLGRTKEAIEENNNLPTNGGLELANDFFGNLNLGSVGSFQYLGPMLVQDRLNPKWEGERSYMKDGNHEDLPWPETTTRQLNLLAPNHIQAGPLADCAVNGNVDPHFLDFADQTKNVAEDRSEKTLQQRERIQPFPGKEAAKAGSVTFFPSGCHGDRGKMGDPLGKQDSQNNRQEISPPRLGKTFPKGVKKSCQRLGHPFAIHMSQTPTKSLVFDNPRVVRFGSLFHHFRGTSRKNCTSSEIVHFGLPVLVRVCLMKYWFPSLFLYENTLNHLAPLVLYSFCRIENLTGCGPKAPAPVGPVGVPGVRPAQA